MNHRDTKFTEKGILNPFLRVLCVSVVHAVGDENEKVNRQGARNAKKSGKRTCFPVNSVSLWFIRSQTKTKR
jgi:hypothetical protein